ncbi:MAG: DUF2283 domain-containing protein [Candidatus Woesearchaeota archaeon]|nr:DUF2283 domain-containing protein [Candidatus Woesearchaeota archaeon]
MNVHYDNKGDFLEISIGNPTKCVAEEIKPGIFIRMDEKNKEVKSVSILNFKKRINSPKDIEILLPV